MRRMFRSYISGSGQSFSIGYDLGLLVELADNLASGADIFLRADNLDQRGLRFIERFIGCRYFYTQGRFNGLCVMVFFSNDQSAGNIRNKGHIFGVLGAGIGHAVSPC